MKSLSSTLLALVFVCLSLVSLMSANRDWTSPFSSLTADNRRLSELGLRFNIER